MENVFLTHCMGREETETDAKRLLSGELQYGWVIEITIQLF